MDCSRLFPPVIPSKQYDPKLHTYLAMLRQCSYLYELLRPELVKMNPVPLCSDAFSPFEKTDPKQQENNHEDQEAVMRLFNTIIPQFVTQLSTLEYYHFDTIKRAMHSVGINLR